MTKFLDTVFSVFNNWDPEKDEKERNQEKNTGQNYSCHNWPHFDHTQVVKRKTQGQSMIEFLLSKEDTWMLCPALLCLFRCAWFMALEKRLSSGPDTGQASLSPQLLLWWRGLKRPRETCNAPSRDICISCEKGLVTSDVMIQFLKSTRVLSVFQFSFLETLSLNKQS